MNKRDKKDFEHPNLERFIQWSSFYHTYFNTCVEKYMYIHLFLFSLISEYHDKYNLYIKYKDYRENICTEQLNVQKANGSERACNITLSVEQLMCSCRIVTVLRGRVGRHNRPGLLTRSIC